MKLRELVNLMNEHDPITLYNGYDKIEFSGFIHELKNLREEEKNFHLTKNIRGIFLDGEKEEIAIMLNE